MTNFRNIFGEKSFWREIFTSIFYARWVNGTVPFRLISLIGATFFKCPQYGSGCTILANLKNNRYSISEFRTDISVKISSIFWPDCYFTMFILLVAFVYPPAAPSKYLSPFFITVCSHPHKCILAALWQDIEQKLSK